ncbi:MAG TPA: bifunctional diaminohydroxyphosphoribosylaminopyrimidine deaminase/5-amino-6-(5-phosphoribosylamino)uracil reductase RibD [Bacteroidota bacterium]
MKTHTDQSYMRRCLELAVSGARRVSPNPMVGCVVVKNGKIIAEGHHRAFGGEHAERMALRKAGKNARGATLYVNLEPCAHHGKTPPCTDAIISAGIRSVVIASQDQNPWVVGRGSRILRRAGIRVRSGILKTDAQLVNEKFFTFAMTGFPFVGIKIAQTLDGKIADAWGKSQWITGEAARTHGHALRAEYDAILIGATTVARDNPQLTVRLVKGRNPLRVVVDGKLSVSVKAKMFNGRTARTIVFTSARAMKTNPRKAQQLASRGVEVIALQNSYSLEPRQILDMLARLNISSVLIEGGPETIKRFVESRLVDKVHCFIAPTILGGGASSWKLSAPFHLAKSTTLIIQNVTTLGNDVLVEGRLNQR